MLLAWPRRRGGEVRSALLPLYEKRALSDSMTPSLEPPTPGFRASCARASAVGLDTLGRALLAIGLPDTGTI